MTGYHVHRFLSLMTSPNRFQSRFGPKFTSDSNLLEQPTSSPSTTAPLSSPYHSDIAPNQTGDYLVLDQILNDLTPVPATTTSSQSSVIPSVKTEAHVGFEPVISHSREPSNYSSANKDQQVIHSFKILPVVFVVSAYRILCI